MLKEKPEKQLKTLLSATAIAVALSVSPAAAQSGDGQTGYIVSGTSVQDQYNTNTDARLRSQSPRSHTAYGTGTTASARGGEIITRDEQSYTRRATQVGDRTLTERATPGTVTTYQQYQTTGEIPVTGRTSYENRQAGSTDPRIPQQDYTPELFPEVETSVGSTITTIDRTSTATKESLYRDFDDPNIRIDRRLGSAIDGPMSGRRTVTTETQTTTYRNR